ncbi:TlpA disulfide reductase family protein [Sphingobacterium sp.]|uniref:TlpA disulfide reductase family protein n=1 Tax=Sphingobacterium sp. TaxID=341027 RepID=UPI0031CE2EB2
MNSVRILPLTGFILILTAINLLFGTTILSAQQRFEIVGSGKTMSDNDMIYLSYKEDGKLIIDSAKVKHKTYRFRGRIGNYPLSASLSRNQNPTHNYDFINDYKSIYLESGKIILRSNDTLSNSILSGTELNQTLQLKDERLFRITDERKRIKDPYFFSAEELKDTLLVKMNQRILDSLFYIWTNQELDFARDFPDSYVSLDLVNRISKINSLIDKTERVFDGLSERLRGMPQANIARNNINGKKKIQIGSDAPFFEIKDIQGNPVKLSSYKGQFVLIDFWASWCLPCREAHPTLIEIDRLYKKRNFSILSISIDRKEDNWKRAVKEDGLTWTQLSDLKASDSDIYKKYGITTIPANFLIDPHGKVIAKDLKGNALKNKIREILK